MVAIVDATRPRQSRHHIRTNDQPLKSTTNKYWRLRSIRGGTLLTIGGVIVHPQIFG